MTKKRRRAGVTIRMGASVFTISFANGDSYDLNAMRPADFDNAISILRSAF